MAANLDMSVFGKAEELKKRLWFTILALIVFRLGTFIPLPGIDPHILADIFDRNSSGILGKRKFGPVDGIPVLAATIIAPPVVPVMNMQIFCVFHREISLPAKVLIPAVRTGQMAGTSVHQSGFCFPFRDDLRGIKVFPHNFSHGAPALLGQL